MSGDLNSVVMDVAHLKVNKSTGSGLQSSVERMATLLGSVAEALKSQKESIVKIVNRVAALELDPESRRASQEGSNHEDRWSSMRGEVDDIKVTVSRMEASLAAQGGRGGKGSAS